MRRNRRGNSLHVGCVILGRSVYDDGRRSRNCSEEKQGKHVRLLQNQGSAENNELHEVSRRQPDRTDIKKVTYDSERNGCINYE